MTKENKMTNITRVGLTRLAALLLFAIVTLSATSPSNARFLSPDTWDPMLPGVDINRYAYGGNDPVNQSDPNGHCTAPMNESCGGPVGTIQLLMPEHTAHFSVNPIGGSVESQIRIGNQLNEMRGVAAAGMTLAVGAQVSVVAGEAAAATMTGATVVRAATAGGLVRVGRWMSKAEYQAMKTTGRVQEGGSGVTNVSNPASRTSYRNANRDDVYVEFDVAASSLRPKDPIRGWSMINGPNSAAARAAQRAGNKTDFSLPRANNVSSPSSSTSTAASTASSTSSSWGAFFRNLFGL